MTGTPHDALQRLLAHSADGELAKLCDEHAVELLVAHGSAVEPDPLRPPRDLDLAFRTRHGTSTDIVALVNALMDAARFEAIDLMDVRRADLVARARALGPKSVLLHESAPSLFAEAQVTAIMMEMETQPWRDLDLRLMAQR